MSTFSQHKNSKSTDTQGGRYPLVSDVLNLLSTPKLYEYFKLVKTEFFFLFNIC